MKKKSWCSFYLDRVGCTTYEKHFFFKYYSFLLQIESLANMKMIKEEGMGIGCVSNGLMKLGVDPNRLYGSDVDVNMVASAKINTKNKVVVYKEDIFSKDKKYTASTTVVCTHGVLEHFSDKKIKAILETYDNHTSPLHSVHYVPTDKYEKPSFGDERLLPQDYWVDTFNPMWFFRENDGKDLYLVFKHN